MITFVRGQKLYNKRLNLTAYYNGTTEIGRAYDYFYVKFDDKTEWEYRQEHGAFPNDLWYLQDTQPA